MLSHCLQVDQLKAENIRLSQQVTDLTKANEALVSSIPHIGEQNRWDPQDISYLQRPSVCTHWWDLVFCQFFMRKCCKH